MTQITIQADGRRLYLRGDTYPVREQIRAMGGHWDAGAGAWWVGAAKRAEAETLAAAPQSTSASQQSGTPERKGDATVVAGKAQYRGRTYYIVGRTIRGRTQWDDRVDAVTTRDGAKMLLAFRDGSQTFWALRADTQISKTYDRPQTIARLARFAEDARHGVSRADYQQAIDAAEDMDAFGEARRLEQIGHAGWRAENAGGAA